MTSKLTRSAFKRVIEENEAWLRANTGDTLERDHIIQIMRESERYYYDKPTDEISVLADRDELASIVRDLAGSVCADGRNVSCHHCGVSRAHNGTTEDCELATAEHAAPCVVGRARVWSEGQQQ